MTASTAGGVATHPLDQRMPRLDALTGARWWAAFFVFTYHMLVFAPVPGITAEVLGKGFFGVTFFFVLSGFVLTWSASRAVSLSTFYWRRFARIWPVHVAATLIAIPVFYSLMPDPDQSWVKPYDVVVLLLSILLLQAWSRDPVVIFAGNPAAWTLSCEALFYAVHPWIGRVMHRWRVRGAVVLALAVVSAAFAYRALVMVAPEALVAQLPLPIVRLSEFVIGMALAWAVRCGWRPRVPVWAAFAVVGAIIIAITVVPTRLTGSLAATAIGGFANELVTVGCAITILAIGLRSLSGKPSLLAHPVLVRLGEWSYAFYLVHATIIYAFLTIFGFQAPSWSNLILYPLLLALAIAAAAVLHHGVEKPIERRMRRWKDDRAARAVKPTIPAAA